MLLAYKKEPEAAVAAMSAWVKKEVLAKEQAAKEKEEKEKEEKASKAKEKEDEDSKADEKSARKGKKAELQAPGISLLAGGAGPSFTMNGLAKPDQIDKGVGTETVSQKVRSCRRLPPLLPLQVQATKQRMDSQKVMDQSKEYCSTV